jgi:hypothetical protein
MRGALLLFAVALTAGCESPEASRMRGGGLGADTGNRTDLVRMHEGSRQFYGTPALVPGQGAPLAPADHAREFPG